MQRPSAILLEAQALRCERNSRPIFRSVDLALHAREAVWMRGSNGSGKTTLLRTLAGLHRPAGGLVRRGASVRYIGHACGLKDLLTVEEGVRFAAELEGVPLDSVGAALARFGLSGLRARRSRQLSQGQRRRVALASLALAQPAGGVWLLDEPFDALDDEGVHCLAGVVRAHCQAGGAVLFTSHQPVGHLLADLSVREWALA